LAPGEISEAEIREILETRSDPDELRERITSYTHDPRPGVNLTTLANRLGSWYRANAEPEDAVNLLKAIDNMEGGSAAESSLYLLGVDMLRRLPESSDRKAIILDALQDHEITPIMVQMMRSLGMEHGYLGRAEQPEEYRTLSVEDFREVEERVAESIRIQAHDGTLLDKDVFDQYIYLWEDISESRPPRDFLFSLVRDDESLVRLLKAYGERSDAAFYGSVAADLEKTPAQLRVQLIENFGLTNEARDTAFALTESPAAWISEEEMNLLTAFVRSYPR
jgi:hypothetical protein